MTESVVLLDDLGNPCGSAPKATIHTTETPLHLGFSVYVLNLSGELLITRRALSKNTWPGVWTNSFCGHPAPGEVLVNAVERRANQELRLRLSQIRCVLPDFQYRAVDSSGIVEYELCPVLVALAATEPEPVLEEVDAAIWADPQDVVEAVRRTPFAFSPWMAEQLSHGELLTEVLSNPEESANH